LQEALETQQADAANSLVYEANVTAMASNAVEPGMRFKQIIFITLFYLIKF